jgi:hypothetical protein
MEVEMTVKPDLSKYRNSYSGGVKAVNKSLWGERKAVERYGGAQYKDGAPPPKDVSGPQRLGDPNNLQGPGYRNDHPNDWVRGANEDATTKPGSIASARKAITGGDDESGTL